MNDEWQSESFCNRWLRSQAELPPRRRSILIYCTLEQQELQSVLAAIRKFDNFMNTGKAGMSVLVKRDVGSIELSVVDSKEMS